MEQDKIVAAILAASLGAQANFKDASDAVSAYRAVLAAMQDDKESSKPLYIGQDEGVPESGDTAIRNLHF